MAKNEIMFITISHAFGDGARPLLRVHRYNRAINPRFPMTPATIDGFRRLEQEGKIKLAHVKIYPSKLVAFYNPVPKRSKL